MKSLSATAHAKIHQRRLRLIETVVAGRYHLFSNLTNRWYRPLNRNPNPDKKKARSKSAEADSGGSDQDQEENFPQDDSEMEDEEAFPENDLHTMATPTASERLARRRQGFPDKNSPVGEIFYGSLLLMGRSYSSALCELMNELQCHAYFDQLG